MPTRPGGRRLRCLLCATLLSACVNTHEVATGGRSEQVRLEEETGKSEGSIVLEREPGTVAYWEHLEQYSINFVIEGTIDSMKTGLVEELDEEFRKPGLRVLVSGTLHEKEGLPQPVLGGQEILALEVSEISIAE